MPNSQQDILQAIHHFIRKYYINRLLRGSLYAIAILFTLFLFATLTEHFGWLSPLLRAIIFYSSLSIALFVLISFVLIPLLKVFGIGKTLTNEQASRIIGQHFPEVQDKLLNLLQLISSQQSSPLSSPDNDLLLATINQRTDQLRPIHFSKAINLSANRRYLCYALPPVIILLLLLILTPHVVSEPSNRILHYNTHFQRPALFHFLIDNPSLQVRQGDDFLLCVHTEGSALPDAVYLVTGNKRQKMKSIGNGSFQILLPQVRHNLPFRLEGGGEQSPVYTLETLPNPTILAMRTILQYPSYTQRASETIHDRGDLSLPEGTIVRWILTLQDADSLCFTINNHHHIIPVNSSHTAQYTHRITQDIPYSIAVNSTFAAAKDTLSYNITAIPDLSPMIAVEQFLDSSLPDQRLFHILIKDDYGFSRLIFHYDLSNNHDPSRSQSDETDLSLSSETTQQHYFTFNLTPLSLLPDDHLTYYFEVWDNDEVHNPKSTRSRTFEVIIPSNEEITQILNQQKSDILQSAKQQISDIQQLQQAINEMLQRLIDKKNLDWQDRQQLQDLVSRQQLLKAKMEQMRQSIQQNNLLEEKYRQQNQQIVERQRELDRLLNEVMDEQMKATLSEIERLMSEMDKRKVQEELEKTHLNNEELARQLDQNIELMKRLELDKRVNNTVQDLRNLAQEQQQLSDNNSPSTNNDNTSSLERQQQLNDKFDSLRKDIEHIQQDFKDLYPKSNLNLSPQLQDNISKHQKNATNNLKQNNSQQASSEQQKAAEELNQLAQQLEDEADKSEEETAAEDAEEIRHLLKNLVNLSFNQENLINEANNTFIQDPKYQEIIAKQNRIREDFRNVEDSLNAIAKRQIQVASAITKEVKSVNNNLSRSLQALLNMNQGYYNNYKNSGAGASMQYTMTSFNNLSLVLAESLEKMQNDMRQSRQQKDKGGSKSQQKGNQQCSNPGSGKPSPKSMREMQEALNRQMEAMRKQLEKEGKQNGGKHRIGGGQGMSEEFAKMAAQQEAIRRMMQEYGQTLKQNDAGNSKLAREIDQLLKQMETTEHDLVNQQITSQTLQRQQQIMTRLLEHERADLQREQDNQRQSRTADQLFNQPSAEELEKYQQQQHNINSSLRSVPPNVTPFYRKKINDYFYN